MIVKNQYPICEFDTSKSPIIHPENFLERTLPKKCVITYLRKELERFAEEHTLPIIGYLKSEVLDIPIYEYTQGEEQLCITMALCGAPGAAVAHYYDIPLAQLLYAGDDVSGEE
jgi:uridine phosphorylase